MSPAGQNWLDCQKEPGCLDQGMSVPGQLPCLGQRIPEILRQARPQPRTSGQNTATASRREPARSTTSFATPEPR